MKEHESDVGQDIDAGWDDIEADVTSVSVKTKVAEELVEVANLDAGWDFDGPGSQLEPKQRDERSTKGNRPQKVNQAVHLDPEPASVVALTKKARRELERQNQIHAAKRKSEAKALRKQQRLANVHQPAEPAPLSKIATTAVPNRNKKSTPKRRKSTQPQSESRPNTRASSERSGTAPDQNRERDSDASTNSGRNSPNSGEVLPTQTQSADASKWRWWALAIAVAIILWVAARWVLSGLK